MRGRKMRVPSAADGNYFVYLQNENGERPIEENPEKQDVQNKPNVKKQKILINNVKTKIL